MDDLMLPRSGALFAAQLRYELRLLLRSPRALGAGLLVPVMLIALRRGDHDVDARTEVAGLTVLGVTLTAYTTHAIGLVTARTSGTLRRWRTTPLPTGCYLAGRIGATVATALASGAVSLAAGALLIGAGVDPREALVTTMVLCVGALAWTSLGTAASSAIPTAEAAWPMLALSYFPVMILSGAFGPERNRGWLDDLARLLPARPLVDATTRAMHGGSVAVGDVVILLAWGAIGCVAAALTFRWDGRATTS